MGSSRNSRGTLSSHPRGAARFTLGASVASRLTSSVMKDGCIVANAASDLGLVFDLFPGRREIGRRFGREDERCARERMLESQLDSMERLPLHSQRWRTAIDRIADE